ncbi:hypothetical protein TNCV_5050811 [Trichonephila clavipes]|nr:hypothetical protein TNCV_5050811 [Trichonephila clavipes]
MLKATKVGAFQSAKSHNSDWMLREDLGGVPNVFFWMEEQVARLWVGDMARGFGVTVHCLAYNDSMPGDNESESRVQTFVGLPMRNDEERVVKPPGVRPWSLRGAFSSDVEIGFETKVDFSGLRGKKSG